MTIIGVVNDCDDYDDDAVHVRFMCMHHFYRGPSIGTTTPIKDR